jgi:CheY-like chemotaxis protein
MRVSLPPAPESLEETPLPAPLPIPASPRGRVLVIDDEELLLQAVRRVLASRHDVDIAESGERALELCATRSYDVILCDLLMPEMSGMDVHAALHESSPALAARMVFMTGGAFTARAKEFLDEIPNVHLEKPVRAEKLLQLIAERVTPA